MTVNTGKDPRCLPLSGQSVERSRTNVQIRVCRRKHKYQDTSVDDVVENLEKQSELMLNQPADLSLTLIPTKVVATTKGEPDAPVFALLAVKSVGDVEGTINPITKTPVRKSVEV
jgi:hypothetical protein